MTAMRFLKDVTGNAMYGSKDSRLKHIHLNWLLQEPLVHIKLEEPLDLNAIKTHWRLPHFLKTAALSFHFMHAVYQSKRY